MILPLINTWLYNTGILFYSTALRLASPFSAKARLFLIGRRGLLNRMEQQLQGDHRKKIWMHCASLGEFEQGRPLLEAIKSDYPQLSIVLTFFSPSGYEARKRYEFADHVFYLPLDTPRNASRFVQIVKPACALFVKYEFWYHYLRTLHNRGIPAILFSAVFQQRHPFFKWYGGLFRQMLHYYTRLFVQDESSVRLLKTIGALHVEKAGDTRFDRAEQVLLLDKSFQTIEAFKGQHKLIVAGSTWPEDELLIQKLMSKLPATFKLLIAPHQVADADIARIEALFRDESCIWAVDEETLKEKRVCIVHTVGQLSYLYKYADVAWIGGGFTRSGIHNVIEPAVFSLPIFFGPRYSRYLEATDMLELGAAKSVENAAELSSALQNEQALLLMGGNARKYVQQHLGATRSIMNYLVEKCF